MDNSKTLLILGNGADLHSGLKTTFNDFMQSDKQASKINNAIKSFDSLKKKLNEYIENEKVNFTDNSVCKKILSFPIYRILIDNLPFNDFVKTLNLEIDYDKNKNSKFKVVNSSWDNFIHDMSKIKGLTLWEVIIILMREQDGSWYDIEKCMKKFFSMKQIISKPTKCAQEYINESISELKSKDIESIKNTVELGNKYEFLILYILYKKKKIDDAQNLLFDELISFEKKFSKYVYDQVNPKKSHNDFYYENTNNLINTLMANSKNDEANLLSFNYTTANHKLNLVKKENNIHGRIQTNVEQKKKINREIIFGIDSTFDTDTSGETFNYSIEAKKNIYKFTKTSRLLKKSINDSINVLDDDIDEIIFYGHSLGESDYSYFQSIFDKYKLYDSNLSLIFAFSKLPDKTKKECIDDQSENVSNLINRYGDTLDNKDHAKNLLHKLLIENRLRLVSLNKTKE